ncbi:PHD finger protein 20 [Nasonia vitripennis]|uniref:PHD finger protein 20 n=1 Tax=Nasonia vitripennis TaxID=7425 RepID=A0A7M7J4A5_NASVI|nr:PHD finger protein 20 [Nasonia vitripennis]
MTHKCCVRDCEEVVKETRSRGLPLHKFPKDPLLRAKWLTSGGFEPDFKPTSSQIVCYRHFRQSDYEIGRSHKLFLKKGSVPSIFADYQAHPDPISPTSAFITSRLQAREVKLAAAAAAANANANANVPAAALLHPACTSDSPLETSCSSLEASMDSSNSLQSANAIRTTPLPEPAAAVESQLSPQLPCKTEQLAQPPPQPQPQPQQSKPADPSKPRLFSRDLNFATGDKLEAKDFNEKWYSARVVETDWVEREVLIHFDKWSSRFDEWIPMDSSRLRALQSHKEPKANKEFAVGERILATWGDGKKYPAKVNAALDNDKYDVLFDDGYAKILKASKMTKLLDMPVSKFPEDSNYVGSKQERRDKKRKHKVTELFPHHSKKKVKNDLDRAAKKHDAADVRPAKSSPKLELATAALSIKPEAESRLDVQPNNELAGALVDDYATFIGNLRVEIEDNIYKCPKTGCIKNFRKENLLLMHIKHYHPEYCKYLGSTPNVADLAYARTIGESVEDVIPKKLKLGASLPTPTFHVTAASAAHATLDSDFHRVEVDNNKLESKLPVENNSSSPMEDNSSEQSNSCTMSPGTLFDMRFKEERTHTGIKTLPPVRQPTFHQVDDGEPLQYSNIASDDQKTTPMAEKEKKHRKKQQPYYCDSIVKVKRQGRMSENEESFDQYDDSLQDVDDVTESSFKCNNTSNNRLEIENNDSTQSKSDGLMMINGEMIKVEKLRREEIINCTCGFTEEDGLMIQCDLCLCWQHGHCNAIEKETDVPEKYICYICQHPYRQRASKKYIHNQDWIREGKLPSVYSRPVDPLKGNERAALLKRSCDLIAALLQIQALLHSLRVKVNIAQNKDHPKLYLWAKNWSKVNIPTFNNEPVPIMEIIKAENTSDNFQKGNTKEKAEFTFSVKNELDEKLITSDTELMKILEEDSTQTEEPKPSTRHIASGNFKDEGRILLDALTRNGLEDQDQQEQLTKSEVNNLDSPIKQNSTLRYSSPEKSSKFQNMSSQSGISEASISHPVIPEPEAPIDPVECKLRLLEHIEHIQNYVDTSLSYVETQISALEDMSSEEKKNNNQHIQTKQTILMLLHDLESIRKVAALC